MVFDKSFLDQLSIQAQASTRLRVNYDLRNSDSDQSQRMLNVLEPGTKMDIHRHTESNEVVCMLRGSIRQTFFDDNAVALQSFLLRAGSESSAMVVPIGVWHRLECLETGTVLLTVKDGPYMPQSSVDILK